MTKLLYASVIMAGHSSDDATFEGQMGGQAGRQKPKFERHFYGFPRTVTHCDMIQVPTRSNGCSNHEKNDLQPYCHSTRDNWAAFYSAILLIMIELLSDRLKEMPLISNKSVSRVTRLTVGHAVLLLQ